MDTARANPRGIIINTAASFILPQLISFRISLLWAAPAPAPAFSAPLATLGYLRRITGGEHDEA